MKSIYILSLLFTILWNVVPSNCINLETADIWKPVNIPHYNISHKFTIALKHNQSNIQILYDIILNDLSDIESINYGHYLTIAEINAIVKTPDSIRFNILDWLNNRNIKCLDYFDNLVCRATLGTIDRILKTKMQKFYNSKTKKSVYTSTKSYVIPTQFANDIVFIDGLSNRLHNHFNTKRNVKSHSTVDPGSISLEVMQRIYNLASTQTGPNVNVGAVEFADSSSLDGFNNITMLEDQLANGVRVNPISLDHLIGKNSGQDLESNLDVQTMYWASSDASLWYETSNDWMYTWAVYFMNRKNVPEVVSISWGWSELDQCTVIKCNHVNSQQYVARTNVEFAKIVARGITIVVSAGDAGSPGRTNENCDSNNPNGIWNHINAIFPGGSPWVLSVGATYLVQDNNLHPDFYTPICTSTKGVTCATGDTEQVTTFDKTGWTSGSGFTHWDPTPEWQKTEVNYYLDHNDHLPDHKYFNTKGRAYPDIAALGHNCIIKDMNGWSNVDGTSCSSPIIAGGIANLNAYQKSRGKPLLGFVNPLFYKLHHRLSETFNDVLVGNSSCTEFACCGPQFGFVAEHGWDPVSGLGTPNYDLLKLMLELY